MATVPTTLPQTSTWDVRSTIGFSSGLSFFACRGPMYVISEL